MMKSVMAIITQNSHTNIAEEKLNKNLKNTIGLLTIGTFLEYFDLMLYVHMSVLLNDLFFPTTDPQIAKLIGITTFVTTYLLRPIGALFFGWIGDKVGRRHTVIITTFLMFICCTTIAILPTYNEIGITASMIMILCRMIQGIACMGEVVGALVYLIENLPKNYKHKITPIIPLAAGIGSLAALGIATISNSIGFSWRMCFWIGAGIAVIGSFSRTTLKESSEFLIAKKQTNQNTNKLNIGHLRKSYIALFCLECMWPLCFYFSFIYCGEFLKTNLSYTSVQVIHQNFIIAFFCIFGSIIKLVLSQFIHPLNILKFYLIVSFIIFGISPSLMKQVSSGYDVGIIQILAVFFVADVKFAASAIYPHFPVLIRFRSTAFSYATSRIVTYIITVFIFQYISETFGTLGVTISIFAAMLLSWWGLRYFCELEKL